MTDNPASSNTVTLYEEHVELDRPDISTLEYVASLDGATSYSVIRRPDQTWDARVYFEWADSEPLGPFDSEIAALRAAAKHLLGLLVAISDATSAARNDHSGHRQDEEKNEKQERRDRLAASPDRAGEPLGEHVHELRRPRQGAPRRPSSPGTNGTDARKAEHGEHRKEQ
jgi:hypothetical protein